LAAPKNNRDHPALLGTDNVKNARSGRGERLSKFTNNM